MLEKKKQAIVEKYELQMKLLKMTKESDITRLEDEARKCSAKVFGRASLLSDILDINERNKTDFE